MAAVVAVVLVRAEKVDGRQRRRRPAQHDGRRHWGCYRHRVKETTEGHEHEPRNSIIIYRVVSYSTV